MTRTPPRAVAARPRQQGAPDCWWMVQPSIRPYETSTDNPDRAAGVATQRLRGMQGCPFAQSRRHPRARPPPPIAPPRQRVAIMNTRPPTYTGKTYRPSSCALEGRHRTSEDMTGVAGHAWRRRIEHAAIGRSHDDAAAGSARSGRHALGRMPTAAPGGGHGRGTCAGAMPRPAAIAAPYDSSLSSNCSYSCTSSSSSSSARSLGRSA